MDTRPALRVRGGWPRRAAAMTRLCAVLLGALLLQAPARAAGPQTAQPPRIFLTKDTLQRVRTSPRWPLLRAALERNLLVNLATDTYQGSHLLWVSNYALGYQVLKDTEPEAASRFADKALALIHGGLHDYQNYGWQTLEVIGRGDGSRRTFPLPHPRPIPRTLHALLVPVRSGRIVRAAGPRDYFDWYSKVLSVSVGADGSGPYQEGVDWYRNTDVPPGYIDWLPTGHVPPTGAGYHVTWTSLAADKSPVPVTQVTDRSITLAIAPSPAQVVTVHYLYGNYQQTSLGDGGFNSILADSGYTSRNLGKNLALGLDWLDGYRGFPKEQRAELIAMLIRWSDYVRDHGYLAETPASNYGDGHYVSRVMTALALEHRSPEGPRLVREVLEYRQKYVVPALKGGPPNLKGGYWAEGWNYGVGGTQNLLLPAYALESAGLIPLAEAERQWAGEVIKHLLAASPAPGQIFGGGDWYGYPPPFPPPSFWLLLGSLADGEAARYAAFALQGIPLTGTPDYFELIFPGPTEAGHSWERLDLNHLAAGSGFVALRSDWGAQPVWLATLFGNLLWCDHQTYSPGLLQINRGADALVVDANALAGNHDPHNKSQFSNTFVIDDGGKGDQTYRYGMGFWYGKPGVVLEAFEEGPDYTRVAGDYGAAYSKAGADGGGRSVSSLKREIVYLRPNRFVIYDRAITKQPGYLKEFRLHALAQPELSGDSFLIVSGQSKLFGRIFAGAPLQTEAAQIKLEGHDVWQFRSHLAGPAPRADYVTLLQVESSSTSAMEPVAQLTANAGVGARFGDDVIIFAASADGLTYTPGTSRGRTVKHRIFGLKPDHAYQASGVPKRVTTNRFGTLSFTAPGEIGSITVR